MPKIEKICLDILFKHNTRKTFLQGCSILEWLQFKECWKFSFSQKNKRKMSVFLQVKRKPHSTFGETDGRKPWQERTRNQLRNNSMKANSLPLPTPFACLVSFESENYRLIFRKNRRTNTMEFRKQLWWRINNKNNIYVHFFFRNSGSETSLSLS